MKKIIIPITIFLVILVVSNGINMYVTKIKIEKEAIEDLSVVYNTIPEDIQKEINAKGEAKKRIFAYRITESPDVFKLEVYHTKAYAKPSDCSYGVTYYNISNGEVVSMKIVQAYSSKYQLKKACNSISKDYDNIIINENVITATSTNIPDNLKYYSSLVDYYTNVYAKSSFGTNVQVIQLD